MDYDAIFQWSSLNIQYSCDNLQRNLFNWMILYCGFSSIDIGLSIMNNYLGFGSHINLIRSRFMDSVLGFVLYIFFKR